jgi:hypothetical protein
MMTPELDTLLALFSPGWSNRGSTEEVICQYRSLASDSELLRIHRELSLLIDTYEEGGLCAYMESRCAYLPQRDWGSYQTWLKHIRQKLS